MSVIRVKRAYEELEREGIIYRRQGWGTFVAEAGHDRMRAGLPASAEKSITQAIQAGREAGMSDRELLQIFKDALKPAPSGVLSRASYSEGSDTFTAGNQQQRAEGKEGTYGSKARAPGAAPYRSVTAKFDAVLHGQQ